MVRFMNDLEVNSVSIERTKEYTEIPNEVFLLFMITAYNDI